MGAVTAYQISGEDKKEGEKERDKNRSGLMVVFKRSTVSKKEYKGGGIAVREIGK